MDWDAVAAGAPVTLDGSTGASALDALVGCPQSARHHAEGDVAAHTELVCAAAAEVLAERGIDGHGAELVRLAALLHDVGKPAVTVEVAPCEYSSPRHAEVGAEVVNALFDAEPALRRRGVAARAAVFAMVRAHMWAWHPESVSVGAAVRTAHLVDLGLLAALWRCDGSGRISDDAETVPERLDWAEMVVADLVGGELVDPYPHISSVCDPHELEPRVRRSVLRAVVTGEVTSPGAAAAHIAAAERHTNGAHILWMCGPPGSGKSTWARRWAERHDAEVLTVTGARRRDRDASRGANRQRLAEIVSRGGRVVVDATHVTRDSRDRLCTLAARYGARLDAVVIDTPVATCIARQRDRGTGAAVPAATIRSMAAALRWPTPDEYDTLTVVTSDGEHTWSAADRWAIGRAEVGVR